MLALFLGTQPLLIGRGRYGRQAQNLLFSYILSQVCGHKLISQNGDPLGCFDRFTLDGRQSVVFSRAIPSTWTVWALAITVATCT
jgi:hypothetical protein